MKLATWHWHIEISSKCTLKCPRCPRAESPETLTNTELSLDFFKRNFTVDFINKHVEKITFCGDDGDPIYAKSLIDVIRYFKSVKPISIIIITNGSHKPAEWWSELGSVLTEKDQVQFSIDGFDQRSNNFYRVNSNWESIINGVKILRSTSNTFMTWAAIGFSFNEAKITTMTNLAKELGFDHFQLTKSTKFGKVYPMYYQRGIDLLQPSDKLICHEQRFVRDLVSLSGREFDGNSKIAEKYLAKVETINNVTPICQIGNKGLYISATGKLYPCCWVANRYSHNTEWNTLALDINDTPLELALKNKFWNEEIETYRWDECKNKCSSTYTSVDYLTSW